MALRLRTRFNPAFSRLILAGLVALALLALGEAAPGAFPVQVVIEAHGTQLQVTVDGQTHALDSALGGNWRGVMLDQPEPLDREYQIDGSDTTSTGDRQVPVILGLLDSPLYRFDAWLRDENSYSRWERLRVTDLVSAEETTRFAIAPTGSASLPSDFRVEVALRRPEAAARLWLLGPTVDRREGLELDRDRRNARWIIERATGREALPRWFFPEQPAPFAAELLQLLGRSVAAGYALVLIALIVGRVVGWQRGGSLPRGTTSIGDTGRSFTRRLKWRPSSRAGVAALAAAALLLAWLTAAALVTVRQYHQLPHILDAVSYSFQAGLFASGQFSLSAPPIPDAFKGPFEVLSGGQLFSQYPPGAPALYALGSLIGLEWLVGPVACALLIAATTWSAKQLFGNTSAVAVLALGVISPFVLFQAGSFLSHAIAAGLLAGALAAFVRAQQKRSPRWYYLVGALLGAGFLTREAASVLFAVPLAAVLLARKQWDATSRVVTAGLPFVMLYLAYNLHQTGSMFLMPRTIFDAADHFGFGDGVGFHTRHTLAAGLANTDELLTLLQLDLFGWPPLFAFGLIALPFLFGRAETWDLVAATGFVVFVAAYAAYFYHGIALGPRYYFEAMPWLLLLAGRGVQTLAEVAGSRITSALIVGVLTLNTLLFYTPAELQRRTDLSGMPGGVRVSLGFVQSTLFGPQLSDVPSGSLVLTDDWWLYNTALAPLNCPRLPQCDVLFALATNPADANRLHAQFPDRTLMRTVNVSGHIDVVPYAG